MSKLDVKSLERAATEARGLAMDAVQAAASGHLGLPLGATEMGAVLYGHALSYNPDKPSWLNRDVFVLSAGHGSMFLYGWLHLAGFNLPMEQVRRFRQLGSITPGHPEFHDTPGVEATTGPLGQGVGNAVGYAVALKMAAARFNTEKHKIFNNHVVCLAGDGCLQEGVSAEASSFAGHFGLDNLIIFFDSNDVTLDAMAIETQSEDHCKRYESYGFETQLVKEGHNMEAILHAYEKAKNSKSGKPQFIEVKTVIAKCIPEVAGTNKGHSEAGVKFIDAARKAIGLPEEKYYVSKETREYFAAHKAKLVDAYNAWEKTFTEWVSANPEKAQLLASAKVKPDVFDLLGRVPKFANAAISTRKAGSDALQPLSQALPLLVGGSADLYGSTLNYINCDKDFNKKNFAGRNMRVGIREHGMGAIMNGMAYYGVFRPSGATFLVFADYLRPSIRLAALARLPVIYIFTHDSVGVGEDGPTHQPVETVSALRLITGLDVIRPGDPEETAGAFVAALEHTEGPTLLALCRQNIPYLESIDVQVRRDGTLRGGYVAVKEEGELKVIIIGTGSELNLAVEAAKQIGAGVRVVSMPCTSRFDRQPVEYRESVLPSKVTKRVVVEAGVSAFWYKYVGFEGKIVGIDRFGISAPGALVLKTLGMTVEHVVETAKSLL